MAEFGGADEVPMTRSLSSNFPPGMLLALGQLRDILPPKSRRQVWGLLFLMLIGTLLDSLSVGVVVPVLALLADPSWLGRFPEVREALSQIGADTPDRVTFVSMGLLVSAYLLKTGFAAFLFHAQSRFSFDLQADLSQQLYEGYLAQPWAFHLQRNSADLIRNASIECQNCAAFCLSALVLLSETSVTLALVVVLVWFQPVGTFSAIVTMGCAAALFQYLTKDRLRRWGEFRLRFDRHRLKQLQQGLGGVKEIKLLGREQTFAASFSEFSRGLSLVLHRHQFASQLPRLWLESVAIIGIATLVVTSVAQERSVQSAIPALGLFAAAAVRLLPSLSRILLSLDSMRFRQSALGDVCRELEGFAAAAPPRSTKTRSEFHRLSLEHVSYQYPGAAQAALCSVSFEIHAGSTIGVSGASGAGKSTLVDLILGLLPPTEGRVLVNGRDIREDLGSWQNSIGYVPQSIYLMDDTIRQNVAFGVPDHEIDDRAVWSALRDAQLEDFVQGLPDGLRAEIGERGVRLSGGQRQRIGIARALYRGPDVLVLDEATSALDEVTESEVMKAVGALRGSKTIIIVAHRPNTLQSCSEIYLIERRGLVLQRAR